MRHTNDEPPANSSRSEFQSFFRASDEGHSSAALLLASSVNGQEKRLRDVVKTISAMNFAALPDGSCTFVNKRWTYTGHSVEETSGTGKARNFSRSS